MLAIVIPDSKEAAEVTDFFTQWDNHTNLRSRNRKDEDIVLQSHSGYTWTNNVETLWLVMCVEDEKEIHVYLKSRIDKDQQRKKFFNL